MPSIDWNQKYWGEHTDWSNGGEGWSSAWGSAELQWYGVILPRIHRFLPAGIILEIAPGFGRWTRYLKDQCKHLIVVDLVEKCIESCKSTFGNCTHISYFVNDGKSLSMINNNSVDFVFSFDSLVHADPSVIRAYISELARILTQEGVAFLHHSNLGTYQYYKRIMGIPKLHALLGRMGIVERNIHNRDLNVNANMLEQFASEADLTCISQETINWGTKKALIDCFTVIGRKGVAVKQNKRLENKRFMEEAKRTRDLSGLYGS